MRAAHVALAFAVVAGASDASATSCSFDVPDELVAGVLLEASVYADVTEAPPGGLWWLGVVDDVDTGRCDALEVRVRGADLNVPGPLVPVDIVRDGPRMMAVRVPLDLAPGTVLDATLACSNGSTNVTTGPLLVGPVLPLEPLAPSLAVTGSEVFAWSTPPCGFGSREQTSHRTFIEVELGDPSRATLLDAWLLEPGGARPAESAARVTDAMFLPVDVATVRVQVHTPGAFDAHLRLTDVVTGATSDVVVVPVDTPAATVGCAQASPGATLAIALFALAVGRRRRPARVDQSSGISSTGIFFGS